MSLWNPESGDPLTASAISVTAVEETSMKLWHEFLAGYFDGNLHMLRGAYVPFPVANKIHFQEDAIISGESAMDGLYIGVTQERPAKALKRLFPGEIWMVTERVKLSLWFRARVKTPQGGQNSHSMVRFGSDAAFAILESNLLSKPLSRKGMSSICVKPPILISGGSLPMRQVSLEATYTYALEETVSAPVIGSDIGGRVVYIGASRRVRVTDSGFECLGDDGNWYVIGVDVLQNGPEVSVNLATLTDPNVAPPLAQPLILGNRLRVKNGVLQYANTTTNTWCSVTTDGDPPQFVLEDTGEAYVPITVAGTTFALSADLRVRLGQLQSWNPTTSLWHNISMDGDPPQWVMSQTGEAT
jgi:hypothetical protein